MTIRTFPLAVLASLAALTLAGAWLLWRAPARGPVKPLAVYAAVGLRGPLDEIAAAYQADVGQPAELHFDGSQTMLVALDAAGDGDVYIPADASYIDIARRRDLVGDAVPLARLRAVVLGRAGLARPPSTGPN